MAKMVKRPWMLPPFDPEKYEVVETRDGYYIRKIPDRKVNDTLQQNADITKITAPLAKNFLAVLFPWIRDLDTARLQVQVLSAWRKEFRRHNVITYKPLCGLEIQPYYPMVKVMDTGPSVIVKDTVVHVNIPIYEGAARRLNNDLERYYFELILLTGDPADPQTLSANSVESPMYFYDFKGTTTCTLSMNLPAREIPWISFLKLSSLEKDAYPIHERHYGMRAIAVNP